MKERRQLFWLRTLSILLSCLLTLSTFTPLIDQASAVEKEPITLGQVIGSGNVQMELPSGEWVNIGNSPFPLNSGGRIRSETGSASITLSGSGIVDIQNNSEVIIEKTAGEFKINLLNGGLSFSIPGSTNFSITTPLAAIKGSHMFASKDVSISSSLQGALPVSRERGGIVQIEQDGSTAVKSLKGEITVATVDGKTQVVAYGDAIRVVQVASAAMTLPGGQTVKTTTEQLETIKAQPGVKFLKTAPAAVPKGDVIVTVPTQLGGGFLVGTPDALATAMNVAGLTVAEAREPRAGIIERTSNALGVGTGTATAIVAGAGVTAAVGTGLLISNALGGDECP